jgi:hypothetical protein
LLIAFAAITVSAQKKSYDLTPDVQVVEISFRDPEYTRFDSRAPFSIDVKNIGNKVIRAVNWDFILIDSIRGDREYDRFRFRTDDKKIRPGEKKRLTKRIDYHQIPNYIRARAMIMRLEFEDGSFWVRGR